MARPRKARVEGEAAANKQGESNYAGDPATGRAAQPAKAVVVGEAVDVEAELEALTRDQIAAGIITAGPHPGDNGAALTRISEYFQAEFPDEWAEWRLCPLEAGLVAMAAKLG